MREAKFDLPTVVDMVHTAEETLEVLDLFLDEGLNEQPLTPSGIPYCGCTTCVVREVLTVLMIPLHDAFRDGLIEVVEVDE